MMQSTGLFSSVTTRRLAQLNVEVKNSKIRDEVETKNSGDDRECGENATFKFAHNCNHNSFLELFGIF